jgi:Fur family ferric uptake transcriptional regulator
MTCIRENIMEADHKSMAEELLQQADLRRTPVRLALLTLLGTSAQPLTAPELLERLPAGTDTVTLYRTLNTFTELQLVHRVRGSDRSARYALGAPQPRAAHRHPHFVCDECGTVECMADAPIPDSLVKSLHVKREYRVKFPEVLLHGVCPKCA